MALFSFVFCYEIVKVVFGYGENFRKTRVLHKDSNLLDKLLLLVSREMSQPMNDDLSCPQA